MIKLALISILLNVLCTQSKSINGNTGDSKLDYMFKDEPSFETTTKVNKAFEVEIEDDVINSGLTSNPEIDLNSTSSDLISSAAPTATTAINDRPICQPETNVPSEKVTEILAKFLPDHLKLRPVVRGAITKIHLDNGKLNINEDYNVMGQPMCSKIDDGLVKYDLMVSLNNLMGSYDWNIYNLFRYNFTESALITIKQIVVELTVTEDSNQKTKLEDIKIGKIDGLDVKVNIPERIASTSFIKPMLEYVISRITTNIANGSMDSIVKNMKDIMNEAIQEKIKINP